MWKPTLLAVVFSWCTTAFAHHGLDLYNTDELIAIEGKVVEFRLMDPHSLLVIETSSKDGTVIQWEVEGGSAAGIVGSGLTREFLRGGPRVRVEGFQTRDGLCAPRCRVAGESFDFEQD